MLHTYDIPTRPFRPDTNMNKYLRLDYLQLTNSILCTRYFNQVKKSNLVPMASEEKLAWRADIFRVQKLSFIYVIPLENVFVH